MREIEIYTDGACSGNPGPGGWAAVLMLNQHKKEISGFEENTTNNRMELKACVESLKALKEKCFVNLYTDSAYVCNAFKENWIASWQNNNWKNSQKKSVLNQDLWQELIELTLKHKVNWFKVKGHSNNFYNNRCDELARGEILKYTKK